MRTFRVYPEKINEAKYFSMLFRLPSCEPQPEFSIDRENGCYVAVYRSSVPDGVVELLREYGRVEAEPSA